MPRRYLPLSSDAALLVLRLALALVLLYHGLPKLMNFGTTVGAFQGMNIPAPTLTVAFAILAEVVVGLGAPLYRAHHGADAGARWTGAVRGREEVRRESREGREGVWVREEGGQAPGAPFPSYYLPHLPA